MKYIFLVIFGLVSFNSISAQTNFFILLKQINLNCTESDFAYKMHKYIEPCAKTEWEEENTECNFKFKDVSVVGQDIINSNIRVNRQTKKLYRLNLIVNDNVTDTLSYHYIRTFLDNQYGSNTIERRQYSNILNTTDIFSTWLNDSNLITLTRFEFKSRSYSTIISVEPITTYHVDHQKLFVDYNKYDLDIPIISYFRLDNDNNVYVKEKDKKEYKLEKVKESVSPKGNIIKLQNGDLFCYRNSDKDIVFIREGLVIRYMVK